MTSQMASSLWNHGKESLIPYRGVLHDIAKHLKKKDIAHIAFQFPKLSTAQRDNIQDGIELFEELERIGELSATNIDHLIEAIGKLQLQEPLIRLKEYKAEYLTSVGGEQTRNKAMASVRVISLENDTQAVEKHRNDAHGGQVERIVYYFGAVENKQEKEQVDVLHEVSTETNETALTIQNTTLPCPPCNGVPDSLQEEFQDEVSKISCEVVAAVDINGVANKVYKYNFPDINLLQRNIQSVTLKDFSRWNADIFLMSPPCQPFTRVGLKGDKNDPRTSSFLYLLQTLPKLSKKPKYLLVENVKGFETSDTRNELVDTLKKCNYKYKEFLLSPKDLGIPNQRLRYFLIAKQDSLNFHGDIQFNNGDTLLMHEISSEDSRHHRHGIGFAAGCMDRMKDSDEATSKIGDSTIIGDSFHIINDSNCRNDIAHSDTDHYQEIDLVEEIQYSLQNQTDKSFIDMSDLLFGSRSIKDYLENLSDVEFGDYLVPEKILVRFGKVMDIVRDSDERTCCFTKAYGHYVEGTGSFLQTNPSVTKHWAFEHQEENEQTISHLRQLCLRYFTPREIANFHHFPRDFAFPSDVSRKQQYRLLGNSLNACVVAVLLRYIVHSQNAT